MSGRRLATVALVVGDYDEAIAWYTEKLGFALAEDADLGGSKRWVTLAAGKSGARLLLAKAEGESQLSRIGDQTGGRVFLFPGDRRFRTATTKRCWRRTFPSGKSRDTKPMARWRCSPTSTAISGT